MKKPVKIALLVMGGIVLLVIAVALFLVLTFDPNKYKAEITAAVNKATGRQLTLDGDIKLSLFPWLGVELGAMQLSNAPGFSNEPFARIRAAAVKVKLLPLLRKEMDVDVVTLNGLRLQLHRDAEGRNNWEDLAGAQKEPEAPSEAASAAPVFAGLALGGINLRDAAITWDDRAAAVRYDVSKLNLNTGPIKPNAPVTLSTDFDLKSAAPALNGHFQLNTQALYHVDSQRLDLNTIKLDARLQTPTLRQADTTLRANAVLDIAQRHYQARDLTLTAKLQDDKLPGKHLDATLTAQIDANLKENRLTVEPLTITTLGLKADGALHGQDLTTTPRFSGGLNVANVHPRELMRGLGLTVPNTADPNALQTASAQLKFNATGNEAALTQINLKLDQTAISGDAAIQNFAKPAMRFNLAIDAIDADRYLPPPAPKDATSDAVNAPVPPTAAATAGAATAPLASLRALDIDGQLKIGKLKIAKLKLNDIDMRLKAKDGVIAARPLLARLYGGTYRGDMRLDARGEALQLATDDVLSAIAVGPLAQDFLGKDLIAGTGNLNVKLTASGPGAEAMRRSLNGKLAFSFTEGRVNGVNLIEMIQNDYLKYIQGMVGDGSRLNQTLFSKFAATAAIANGVINTDDLTLNSAQLNVKGRGNISLVNEQIDVRLDATPTGQLAKQLGDFKDVVVPIKVKGTLTAPSYRVDLGDALKQKAKARLDAEKQKLEQTLQQEIDKQKQDAQQNLRQEQKKLEDKLQQQLQNKLKGLFK